MDNSDAAVASRFEKVALVSGVAAPLLYFGSVVTAALSYPGFSLIRQFASELGANDAPHPLILNVGVVLSGVATILAGAGFRMALARLGARDVWRRWASITTAALGAALGVAGLFPLPNWWHYVGSSLAFPAILAPLLLALALRQCPQARGLRWYLVVNNVLMVLAYFAFVCGRGSNILGLLQLLYTLLAIPWVAVAAYVLLRLPNVEQAGAGGAQIDVPPVDAFTPAQSRESKDTSCRTSLPQLGTA
jgi:hypothetical membrane protein